MRPARRPPRSWARCSSLTAATFDAEPLYVAGIGLRRAGRRVAAVGRARRRAGCASSARWARGARRGASRCHRHHGLAAGGCRCPAGFIEDDLLPAPAPLAAGAGAREVPHQRALRPPRAQGARRRRASSSATRSAWPTARRDRRASAAELLVLPRIEPVVTPAGRGRRQRAARRAAGARRSPPRSTSTACARYRPGAPASRIYWPALARGGELIERRLRADGDTRPLVVLDPRAPGARGGPRRGRARRGLAVRAPGARRRLRAAAARRPAPDACSSPTLAGWPHLHVRLALVDDRAGAERGRRWPRAAGRPLRRRAPAGARAARAGPRRGGGRCSSCPGGDGPARRSAPAPRRRVGGRRAVFTVAGCTGYELSGTRRVAEVA